ncbi:hypothetical protein CEP66_23095 [Citrobacter koseri]|nr:hypothetical protein CEP66_23095 [Citrobacter koseri]ATF99911.1 hypothetical protein CO700_07560 [Citrobacter koseri]AVE61286.1 hypothetical protein AM352_18285 [Citrobacter koseri]AVE70763.1 hypothetical protein AM351_09875 [Citrobacter koseri]PNN15788.1 hypothetical protein AL526_022000 [Citrobacter koseri]
MQLIKNVTIDTVEIFARALLAIYHYYCLSVFLPYSCLTLLTSLFRVDAHHNRPNPEGLTARNARAYGEKTVAGWQLSTSRMASVHAMRRFH